MTKHMHMRHMYISIAAVTVRLLIMAVLLSSRFPDYLRDEGIIAPPARFVNSFFEKFFLCRLNMNRVSVSRKDLLSKALWCKIYIERKTV